MSTTHLDQSSSGTTGFGFQFGICVVRYMYETSYGWRKGAPGVISNADSHNALAD